MCTGVFFCVCFALTKLLQHRAKWLRIPHLVQLLPYLLAKCVVQHNLHALALEWWSFLVGFLERCQESLPVSRLRLLLVPFTVCGIMHQLDFLVCYRLPRVITSVTATATTGALHCMWGHASVRLPGVLQTNVGHSNFRYVLLKKNHIILHNCI